MSQVLLLYFARSATSRIMWKRASDSYFELLLPCFAWRMMLFWFILHKQLILLLVRLGLHPSSSSLMRTKNGRPDVLLAGAKSRINICLHLFQDEHYQVTMSCALMAFYYISWRLENNVMSSKYLVMRALHDH